jgi:hypothetical protein
MSAPPSHDTGTLDPAQAVADGTVAIAGDPSGLQRLV